MSDDAEAAETGFFDDRVDLRNSRGEKASPLESIIPIGFFDPPNGPFYPFATGIFINAHGLFCTAKHVFEFEDNFLKSLSFLSPDAYLATYQYFPDHTTAVRSLAAAHTHSRFDLAIGVCEPLRHTATGKPFHNSTQALSHDQLQIGALVHQYSYPDPILTMEDGKLDTVMIPLSTPGRIIDWLPNGMGSLFPSPAYVIEGYIGAGSSGGPVMDTSGRTVAICSRGCADANYYYAVPVREISEIVLPSVGLSGDPPVLNPTVRDMMDRSLISFAGPLSIPR